MTDAPAPPLPRPMDCQHCREQVSRWTGLGAETYCCTLTGWWICVHSDPRLRTALNIGRCAKFSPREAT